MPNVLRVGTDYKQKGQAEAIRTDFGWWVQALLDIVDQAKAVE